MSIGVLTKCADSEWGSPSFIMPKNNGTVRFSCNLCQANKQAIHKPFPMRKISDVMQTLQGFQFATALDLNMGYHHVRLDPGAQKMHAAVLPWGKCKFLRLPIGLAGLQTCFKKG